MVQLKIKLADFTLLTRRTTLAEPTDDGQALYRAAAELLARERLPRRVRLTGVSAQDLSAEGAAPQLALFRSGPTRADRLNAALDRIASKFGSDAVVPADVAEMEARRSRCGTTSAQEATVRTSAWPQREPDKRRPPPSRLAVLLLGGRNRRQYDRAAR